METLNLSSVRGPTMQTGASWLVPVFMRDDAGEGVQPHDLTWTSVRKLPMAIPSVAEEFTDCVPVAVR